MHNEPQAKKPEPKTGTDLQQMEARVEALKAEIAEPKTQAPVLRVIPLPSPEEQARLLSVRDKCRAMVGSEPAVTASLTDDFEEIEDLETFKTGWANWLEKVDDVSELMDLAALPPQQRAVYSLFEEYRLPDGNRLPDREIGRRLGIHPKTVYEHKAAAENAIRLSKCTNRSRIR